MEDAGSARVKPSECRHSHAGGRRPQGVSRGETERVSAGTHALEGGGREVSAEVRLGEWARALACWRAEDTGCPRGWDRASERRHSHTRGQRTQGVSRGETE